MCVCIYLYIYILYPCFSSHGKRWPPIHCCSTVRSTGGRTRWWVAWPQRLTKWPDPTLNLGFWGLCYSCGKNELCMIIYELYRYHPIMFWGCQHGRHDSTCKIWLFYFSWDLHYLELDNPINQSKCSPSTLTNTIIWKSIECPPSQIPRGCKCQGWPHSIYFRMGRFT
jgi:hypothetical protein